MILGRLYATKYVKDKTDENAIFKKDIQIAVGKFINNDWGETSPEDALLNDIALSTGERIIAVYITCYGPIWILSEFNRQLTTILFPFEY